MSSGNRKRFNQNSHPVMRVMVVLYALATIVPLLVMAVWSVVSIWPYPQIIPDAWTLRGFESLFRPSSEFFPILGSSMFIAFVVCSLGVIIATLAAQALAFYDFPGKHVLDFLVFLPAIVPAVVFGIGIHVLFIRLGLTNTFFGVILVQLIAGVPFAVKMMTNATRMLGNSLTEQAVVLGSTPFKAFFQVCLHPLLPTMISSACMIFTVSFSDYFLTFLIGGGKIKTFATVLVPMISGSDTNMTAAYAVVYLILSFLVFLVLEGVGRRILKKQTLYLV